MKLKIAFFLDKFPSITETFIVNQIIDLINRGHDVKIFAVQEGSRSILHQNISKYNLLEKTKFQREIYISKANRYFPFIKFVSENYHDINFKKLFKNFSLKKRGLSGFNLNFFYEHYWLLRSANYDIIHAHFGANAEYICKLRTLGFLKNSKIVSTFHGYDMSPQILKKYRNHYSCLFQESDLITVNTVYAKSLIENLTSKKIEILPVGLNIEKFESRKNKGATFNILFVGRLIELKAPNLVIEIFKILKIRGYTNIKLKIVGDGELKDQLLSLIDDYNLKDSVKLLGTKTQEEIIEVMNESDVLIMPGVYDSTGRAETQGLVIQEAQSMKIPVIVSDVGGMKYGIKDKETGYIVKENDLDDFADKVEILINNKNLATEMGERGRWFVTKNYSSKLLGDQLEALYYSVIV